MDSEFSKIYYDESAAGSFSGFDKFWDSVRHKYPNANRSDAQQWYSSQALTQENKTSRRPDIYRKWTIGNIATFMSMDNLFVGRRYGPNYYEQAYTGKL